MTGPLAATSVPSACSTSVCGVSPDVFPTHSFYRTNFGGRFGTTLKLAGWDVQHGWPTRKTLEALQLNEVADTLAGRHRLGA